MALRMGSQRWASSPLMQSVMRSGVQQQRRTFADEYTGKALDDKEKANENRYIKKMEEEQRRKKAVEAEIASRASPAGGAYSSANEAPKPEAPSVESGYRSTAIVAGLVAAIAGYWLLSGSSKKKEEDKESS